MPKSDPHCLHCIVTETIKQKQEELGVHFTQKDIILRLSEVIADMIMHVESGTKRAQLYEYWGDIMCELMREIETGEYK